MKAKTLRQIISAFFATSHTAWTVVKHFHPEGKGMPNGSHYQRGGFLHECKENANSFVLTEEVYGKQPAAEKCCGGVLVLPAGAEAVELEENALKNIMEQALCKISVEPACAYSVGNFFRGKYVGANGKVYGEKSLAVEINGVSSKALLRIAEQILRELHQTSALVKDLNNNKLFNSKSSGSMLGA